MAAIVNARDLRLQAYSPRVASISNSPGILISQDQVTGLGLVLAGTKMLFLSASSQVFQVAKTGVISPPSTTIKATLKNISATPTLTVVAGTITPAPVLSNGSVVVPYGSLITDAATIRLTAVQGGVTYFDEVTIVKVREGIDGLVGFLTNEAHTVAADYLGNVLAYTNAGGNFKVFQGVNDITSLCTFSIPDGGNTNALTASINSTTGVYKVIGGYPTNVDLAVVLLRATFGTVVLDKVFTLAKTKAGVPGVNGTNGTSGTDGKRGSRTFYVTLTGSTAVFSDTFATTVASVEGGPVLNDLVTEYNTSQGFSQTKFYTAAGWVIVNAVVDGNLIVSGTIGATQIQSNLLNSDNVLTRGLTVRDYNGNIILSSGTPLDYAKVGGTKPPANATVGATFGSDINGKITAALSSTYIADAAIVDAQILTLDAQKINTGYLSADRIKAGTLDVSKLNIGVSPNILNNSGFAAGTYGWTLVETGSLDISALGSNLPPWTPLSGNAIYIVQMNNIGAGRSDYSQSILSKQSPASYGNRYEFSVYTGAHRCYVSCRIYFYDVNGAVIQFATSNINYAENTGGMLLSGYKRIFGFAAAPYGTASVAMAVVKTATLVGERNSYLFATQAMIAVASENQTLPSAWSLGGSGTKITGAGIETNSITADNINGTNLAVVNGTFSGSLKAASGTFSGTLTADAINAVNTINISGNSITVPFFARTGQTAYGDISCQSLKQFMPANSIMIIFSTFTVYQSGFKGANGNVYVNGQNVGSTGFSFENYGSGTLVGNYTVPVDGYYDVTVYINGESGGVCTGCTLTAFGGKK